VVCGGRAAKKKAPGDSSAGARFGVDFWEWAKCRFPTKKLAWPVYHSPNIHFLMSLIRNEKIFLFFSERLSLERAILCKDCKDEWFLVGETLDLQR
jgi:hypothetical protein